MEPALRSRLWPGLLETPGVRKAWLYEKVSYTKCLETYNSICERAWSPRFTVRAIRNSS